MDMIGKIRRMNRGRKKAGREIARTTRLSRNIVAKWLHGEMGVGPRYRRDLQPTKITAFQAVLKLNRPGFRGRLGVRKSRTPFELYRRQSFI